MLGACARTRSRPAPAAALCRLLNPASATPLTGPRRQELEGIEAEIAGLDAADDDGGADADNGAGADAGAAAAAAAPDSKPADAADAGGNKENDAPVGGA
jgi:hypothetical protein